MIENIKNSLVESADLKRIIAEELSEKIEQAINLIHNSLKKNKKVLLMGNGLSAGDAQRLAAELIGKFKLKRQSI